MLKVKHADIIYYKLTSLDLWNKEISKNPKNRWKLMKIGNIDRENLHMFWTTREISMKFSEKKWLMIMLKVTKNQGFTFSFEDTFLEKLQGDQIDPPTFKG